MPRWSTMYSKVRGIFVVALLAGAYGVLHSLSTGDWSSLGVWAPFATSGFNWLLSWFIKETNYGGDELS